MTALAAAAARGHTESVRVLLMRGASPSIPTNDNRAPAFLAAVGGHLAILELLLEAFGPDRKEEVWRANAAGRTPVMGASANGHLECLRALIEGGGDGKPRAGAREKGAWKQYRREATELAGRVGGGSEVTRGLSTAEGEASAGRGGEGVRVDGAIDDVDVEGRTALMHACMFDQVRPSRAKASCFYLFILFFINPLLSFFFFPFFFPVDASFSALPWLRARPAPGALSLSHAF